MATVDEVRSLAMTLSNDDRLTLAEELVASVPFDEVWRREWAEESHRRYEEMKSGKVASLTWETITPSAAHPRRSGSMRRSCVRFGRFAITRRVERRHPATPAP